MRFSSALPVFAILICLSLGSAWSQDAPPKTNERAVPGIVPELPAEAATDKPSDDGAAVVPDSTPEDAAKAADQIGAAAKAAEEVVEAAADPATAESAPAEKPAEKPKPLLEDPSSIFIFLLSLVGLVFALSKVERFKGFFHFCPPLIFCYFLPMIATTLGVTPQANSLYGWFNKFFLPPTLLLLLLSADIKAILKLGPKAIGIMVLGGVGIILGGAFGYAIFASKLDPDAWKNIGALVGSWTGGSANMFAVKEALHIPEQVFSPMIIVDSVIVYSWMGIVIAMAAYQNGYAKRYGVDMSAVDEMNKRLADFTAQKRRPLTTDASVLTIAVALVGGFVCFKLGYATADLIKPIVDQFNSGSTSDLIIASLLKVGSGFTFTVVYVTILGVVLSFSPVGKLEETGASAMGYTMLYLLLPMFGAQANLRDIGAIPIYAVIGLMMLAGHVLFLFIGMRLFKTPLFFGAVASQANMGGAASASLVATTYQPSLAPMGILLGIFGGIVGTFMGLGAGLLCSLFAP